MPPWKPERRQGRVSRTSARLTDHELDVDSAVDRRAALRKATPRIFRRCRAWTDGWRLGTPDLVVRMPEALTGAGRTAPTCFARSCMPIPRLASALRPRDRVPPGNARVVHHANLGVDRTRSSRLLDERDPEPGYVGGMVPSTRRYPEGSCSAGRRGRRRMRSRRGMQLAPRAGQRSRRPAAPAADREAGAAAGVGRPLLHRRRADAAHRSRLRLGSETIDIPPGAHEYIVSDTYRLPVDVEVLAIQPHAHNLARQMTATAALAGRHARAG